MIRRRWYADPGWQVGMTYGPFDDEAAARRFAGERGRVVRARSPYAATRKITRLGPKR